MKKGFVSLLVAFALIFGMVQPAQASEATPLNSTISKLLGVKYRAGGSNARTGFDCSGFTSFVFAQFKMKLPHQSASQAQLGTKVLKSNLRPGDLVFFNTNGRTISHVGIYTGNGKFAHAARQGIVIDNMNSGYYLNRYVTARRVLSDYNFTKLATLTPVKTVVVAAKPEVVATAEETSSSTAVVETTGFDLNEYIKALSSTDESNATNELQDVEEISSADRSDS
jgi:hypothetical protein